MLNEFAKECKKFLGDRLYDKYILRFAHSIDASCYRYIPKLVLKVKNEEEVCKIIKLSNKYNIALTFKGAGTSLSGQACSNSVLVLTMYKMKDIKVSSDYISCSCAVIGADANIALKHLNKKIGPDPATLNNASIGGIFSNNSSGMCCGVSYNSYHTVKSIRVILNDGYILDTSDEDNVNYFMHTHSDMVNKIYNLREEIIQDEELVKNIERKYKIKNTTGYSINALSDFSNIVDILNHIFIGAEGTLGFVSKVEYYLVDDYLHKTCALIFYKNLSLAAKAVNILAENKNKVSAAELMDYACLKSVSHLEDMPEQLNNIKEGNCCILVQLESNSKEQLEKNVQFITKALSVVNNLFGINFSYDEKICENWWKVRKALLPICAKQREAKSTIITEDVCFTMQTFEEGINEISMLFKKHNFNGIIFGHALSFNVHFIISVVLDDEKSSKNFANFIDDLAAMVCKLDGSIKAEHGTGRMMAPFVEMEWGKKAYEINKKIKNIFDSKNLFNPDVIISDDRQIHLKNLKPSHEIDEYLQYCMECGFCEKVCPSKNLSLSPRQRIAVKKEIARLKQLNTKNKEEQEQLEQLLKDYEYYAINTCAQCSMCASACPLEINSANIADEYKNSHSKGLFLANKIAQNLKTTSFYTKKALKVVNWLNKKDFLSQASIAFNAIFKTAILPTNMLNANDYKLNSKDYNFTNNVVYFSSCLNRLFKIEKNKSIQEVFENLCKKAKINCIYPEDIEELCCSKAFKDYSLKKDMFDIAKKSLTSLLKASKDGRIIIVSDHSACSAQMLDNLKKYPEFKKLKIMDMQSYIVKHILHKLKIRAIDENIGIYSVCASKKNNWTSDIKTIAKSCTKANIYEHTNTFCCAFAGNKGFIRPELNKSALEDFTEYFSTKKVKKIYSTSSTCELGISFNTNIKCENIIYLLDELS